MAPKQSKAIHRAVKVMPVSSVRCFFCHFVFLLRVKLQQKFKFGTNSGMEIGGLWTRSTVNYHVTSTLGLTQVWTHLSDDCPCHSTHHVSYGPDRVGQRDAWGKPSSLIKSLNAHNELRSWRTLFKKAFNLYSLTWAWMGSKLTFWMRQFAVDARRQSITLYLGLSGGRGDEWNCSV